MKSQTTVLRRLRGYRSTNRSHSVAQLVQSRHTCDQSGEARMRRREFAKLVAATIAWPITASARKAMPVIGILGATSPDSPLVAANLTGFRRGLNETGVEGGPN